MNETARESQKLLDEKKKSKEDDPENQPPWG